MPPKWDNKKVSNVLLIVGHKKKVERKRRKTKEERGKSKEARRKKKEKEESFIEIGVVLLDHKNSAQTEALPLIKLRTYF